MSDRKRELQWCLSGPDLLASPCLPLAGLTEWLQRCPEKAIDEHFSSLPSRIGRRFERHWAWVMSQLPGWTLHAADRQITLGGRTLGAPDLLLSGHGEVWHVELAVKYYLCAPTKDGSGTDSWLGPSSNDRLDLKLRRLYEHQLMLLKRPDTREWLTAQGLPLPTRYTAILKGVLFQHWRQSCRGPGDHPPAGRWCRLDELPDALESAQVLSRDQWLGGHSESAPLSGGRLYSAVADSIDRTGTAQLSRMKTRWIVVANTWP